MGRIFNTNGCCSAELHYMADLTARLRDIRAILCPDYVKNQKRVLS